TRGAPICFGASVFAIAERIERPVFLRFFGIRHYRCDAVHRIHLGGQRSMHVGNNRILSLGMRQANWLTTKIEQVHDGGAPKLERFGGHGGFQKRCTICPLKFVKENDDFHPIGKWSTRYLVELSDIKEEKFLRETKVFLQQPVTLKAGLMIRKH